MLRFQRSRTFTSVLQATWLILAGIAGAGTAVQAQQSMLKFCPRWVEVCLEQPRMGPCQKKAFYPQCISGNKDQSEVTALVYSTAEMDSKLAASDANILERQQKIRTDIEITIAETLKSLPAKLFSEDIKSQLRQELVDEFDAAIEEMKIEIVEEIKAVLLPELVSMIETRMGHEGALGDE